MKACYRHKCDFCRIGEFKELQKVGLKNRYPFDIQITNLPSSKGKLCSILPYRRGMLIVIAGLVMAICGTEKSVSIYHMSSDSEKVSSFQR